MAELLPVLDERTFSEQELSGCKEGECCQCGMCCIAYRVQVPAEPGNVNSPLMMKAAGVRCPQLYEGERGRLMCLLQNHKGHPALAICAEWRGDKRGLLMGDLAYDDLNENIADWILHPDSLEQVALIRDRLRRGAIAEEVRRHYAHFFTNPSNLTLVLRRYLIDFQVLPHDIFSFVGIPKEVRKRADDMRFILADIGFSNRHPFYDEFSETYLSALTAI